jgi:hypothetical protein
VSRAANIALFGLLCAAGCGHRSAEAPETTWGIQPVSLRPTFGGNMLDFRFKVVDAKKALPLFDRKMKPVLYDPKSGVALGMPDDEKVGSLRASVRNPPVAGKQYYVLFSNGFGTVKKGSKVTIVMGNCKLKNVVVN